VALPLVTREVVRGALLVYSSRGGVFDEKTVSLLQRFADQLALTLVEAEQLEKIQLQTAALEAAANAVMITDRNGRVEWANPAFAELTGWALQEVLGKTPRFLKAGIQSEHLYGQLWETILSGNVWRGEMYNRRKDGVIYVEEQTITPVRDEDGEVHHFVAIKQDITQRRKTEERIRHLALHDSLTDLPNRRSVEEALERMVAWARRGILGTLILLDLDNFKIVNDSLGHPAGDRVLVDLARLLVAAVRPGDEVARLGGDEFVVLLEGVTIESGLATAERLRRLVDEHRFQVDERVFDLGISAGVVPVDGRLDASAVLALADTALYAAKDRGRNRVLLFDSEASRLSTLTVASEWASRIKDGLRDGSFILLFQPIVRLETGLAVHYEALLRLRSESGELVLPASFLGAAERFGLMPQIDIWVVEQVLSILTKRAGLEIFVNLAGASLGHEGLIAEIEDKVEESGIGPGRLAFEITETTAVADIIAARHWMRRLKDLGCRFALDDFGIGFSSFAYLQSLPADYVKIDGSFIRDLESNMANRALVKAIDTVAHTLGKETIAESVESLGAIPLLRELGIECAQGFALGSPSPELPGV
jgi:diguanylate cyclase (GGDEF)-like protein/PAS domain S-box-containing protein